MELLVVVTLRLKLHSELQLMAMLLWEGCLCPGGCGSLGQPKSIPNVPPKSGGSLCSLRQPQVAVQGELWLSRELLLLSVTTGHSLHMHSVDATIKHKIIESSDWKKIPQIHSKVGYSGQTDCTQSLDRYLQS